MGMSNNEQSISDFDFTEMGLIGSLIQRYHYDEYLD